MIASFQRTAPRKPSAAVTLMGIDRLKRRRVVFASDGRIFDSLPAGYDVCPDARALRTPPGLFGAMATDGTIHTTSALARAWDDARNTLKGNN